MTVWGWGWFLEVADEREQLEQLLTLIKPYPDTRFFRDWVGLVTPLRILLLPAG